MSKSNNVKQSWDTVSVSEEWHDKPIPLNGRLGFLEPAIIWSGFGIAFICAVIGGIIQQGLGTVDAILAIITGNVILFLYASAIGYPAGKWGLNFPLTIKSVFGGKTNRSLTWVSQKKSFGKVNLVKAASSEIKRSVDS